MLYGMLSLQNQETAQSVPDPFPLFGGGVWGRDYFDNGGQSFCYGYG